MFSSDVSKNLKHERTFLFFFFFFFFFVNVPSGLIWDLENLSISASFIVFFFSWSANYNILR